MAQLTINTTTLMGVAAPNARVDIRLFREGLGATSVIHGASGVVTDADERLTTDASGQVLVELAPTASYAVQTYYEVRVGGLTGRFTMPETDAVLTDRLQSEDVEVQATTGVDASTVRQLIAVEVADWALDGNTDQIPANKLGNVPSAGLDTAAVDARIADWAEQGNTQSIPDSKIPASIARDSEVPDDAEIDGRARAVVAAGVSDWAEAGNTDGIPDSKIPSNIARDSEIPDVSSFQSRAQVDARVQAGVADWAEASNGDTIPDAKIPASIARDSELPDISGLQNQSQVDTRIRALTENFAEVGNGTQIPDSKIPDSIARDSEIPDVSGFLSQTQVDARVAAGVSDWAEPGNTDQIPLNKLGNAPSGGGGGGLSTAQVRSLISDWAEQDNGDNIPADKLGNQRFTEADNAKLDGIADSADNNVRSDWNQTNAAMDDFIRNKPTIPDPADWAETGNSDPVPANKLGNQRFTAADETKLDGIQAGAQANVGEEFTTADHTKLDGIETGAQRNVGVEYTSAARTKLDGIQANAEVNIPADWDATGGDAAIRNKPGDGELVPSGGTTGQVLSKTSGTNYDTEWANAATGGATRFVALTDTPSALGTSGQVAAVNAAGNALEFVDAASGASGGGGNATRLVGQGAFNVTSFTAYATEANSADITLDDSDWFWVSIRDEGISASYARINGDEWRGLTAYAYGANYRPDAATLATSTISATFSNSTGTVRTVWLGRTSDNKVLVSGSSTGDDPMPLVIYGETEASGSGGGGGGDLLTLLGSANVDAAPAGLQPTGITLDDSQVFGITFGANADFPSSVFLVLGDDIRSLAPNTGSLRVLRDASFSVISVGRTAANELLVDANTTLGGFEEFMPVTLYSVNASGGGGGGGGGASDFVSLTDTPDALGSAGQVPVVSSDGTALIFAEQAAAETFSDLTDTPAAIGTAGQAVIVNPLGTGLAYADVGEAGEVSFESAISDLPIGPVRQVVRGTVPDDTAVLPNTTTFTLPIATAGRVLEESVSVAADNNSVIIGSAGSYFLVLDLEASASILTNAHQAPSGNAVIRGEGVIEILQNGNIVARGVMSYARYGNWQIDGIGGAPIVADVGDTITLQAAVRRIDSGIGSLNWQGSIRLVHQYVVGSTTVVGVRSDTISRIVSLTQAEYDALPSPDARTEYIVSG